MPQAKPENLGSWDPQILVFLQVCPDKPILIWISILKIWVISNFRIFPSGFTIGCQIDWMPLPTLLMLGTSYTSLMVCTISMYYLDLEIVPVKKCDTLVGLVAFEWYRCDETREGVVCCLKPLHLLQWGQPICVVRGKKNGVIKSVISFLGTE